MMRPWMVPISPNRVARFESCGRNTVPARTFGISSRAVASTARRISFSVRFDRRSAAFRIFASGVALELQSCTALA
jgi:hypothetical protein